LEVPAFWRIQSLSRPESGETHVTRDEKLRERIPTQSTIAPAWPELSAEARAALTSLMTQLILDHAATTATPRAKEVDHDL
jgi:hypothetical protein